MISRCPSCAAEVDEAANRCPSCHWDFELRRRVPPEGDEAPAEKPEEKAAPEKPRAEPEKSAPEQAKFSGNIPASGGEKLKPAPERRKPEPEDDDDKFSPEPQLPLGAGLKQFGKLEPTDKPAEKREEKPAEKPFEKPVEKSAEKRTPKPAEKPKEPVAEKAGFSIPVARDPKREMQGPPATEVRILPSSEKDKAKEKPKDAKEKEPKEKESREKEREKERERQDAADRFKKRGKTQPKDPTVAKPAGGSPFNPRVAAAVIVVVVIALVAGYFGLRPEKAGAVGKNSPNFPKNSNSISVPGFGEQQPDRDINHIQRVALDTEHPQAPPVKPAPPAPPPVPAPTPAPVAPPPPAAPGVQQWQFEGQAYDLITLKPIPGATLSFRVSGNDAAAPVPVKTDANGRFKAFFQAMPGGAYELTASHPDYLDGYIDEMSPPLKEADLGDRRMLAASAGRNTRWAGRGAKGIDKRDIILIPKLIPEDAQ